MWKKLRSLVDKTNRWPIIIGAENYASEVFELGTETHRQPVATILAAANNVNIDDYLGAHGFEETADETNWPTMRYTPPNFSLTFDPLKQQPHPSVAIALLPTPIGAEAPAYLRFGGRNKSPSPDIHVAFAHYWNKHYGAEIVGISSDTLEFSVARPPVMRDAALVLARLHYAYCQDIAELIDSIPAHASTLLNHPLWHFWWD